MLLTTVNNTVHIVRYSITYAIVLTVYLQLSVNNTILLHLWLDANCISLALYCTCTVHQDRKAESNRIE